ncbi:MAG: DNA polymerase II large subunit [Candidatus Norongarragalinales archaeon]
MNTQNSSQEMKGYFRMLEGELQKQLEAAGKARERNLDPVATVEIAPAQDVAARVEGLVGPKGVAETIRALGEQHNREKTCFEIAKKILEKQFSLQESQEKTDSKEDKEKLIEQAVRTGLALFTEGVVSAPIEGVSKIKIKQNPDGSDYVGVYFAGPIRGAGGTGQAFALLLADYCRKFFGIREYRPLESELERYVEETGLYARKTRAGQYVPTREETIWVVKNCPVRIDGEPTEEYEVSVNRDVASIETNRVRSGVCLVIGEGVCLKAAKVLKIAKKNGLDWQWLENLIKVAKQEAKKVEIKPNERFMEEIVAGRPIFSFPMRKGGFRLRYGRTRFTGILAKAIHPATMVLLDDFPVFGTQVKTERPAKGCIVTPCETIDGPIVLLDDDSVKKISNIDEAYALRNKVKEILFLGDMLCCYGDFNKSAHPLVPSPWVEEWLALELKGRGIEKTAQELKTISFDGAKELCEKHGVPLAPSHTLFWSDLNAEELEKLVAYLEKGRLEMEWFEFKSFSLPLAQEKTILENLGVEHSVKESEIIFGKDAALSLLAPLGMLKSKKLDASAVRKAIAESKDKSVLQIINSVSPFEIRGKSGVYVGSAMGRPEKSRERKMKPPVHSLFPIGFLGGKVRSVKKAYATVKQSGGSPTAEFELEVRKCADCGKQNWARKCDCGGKTTPAFKCPKCGRLNEKQECQCGSEGAAFEIQQLNLVRAVDNAIAKTGLVPDEVKAVQGLISARKTPEALEKGFLRAKHGITVFRDGTSRFDATEIPCTHFYPAEIGTSVEKLREMGYEKDALGNALENESQLVELKPQDIIVSQECMQYLLRVSRFIDDLLVYFYNLPAFYNASSEKDLVGTQSIAIAPHTSAGIVCRVIGYAQVQGIIAHPYLHCACRRNADGDELAIIMMMDGLLNFSREFLPETRGGKMDAPLVLTTILDPLEVDDEVHAMDRAWAYPLEFYQATLNYSSPGEVQIETISDTLGKEQQYEGIGFTHACTIDPLTPFRSSYVKLATSMQQKLEAELRLMEKIRAVDAQQAAERIILSHFFPDLYGNLRSFSRQKFRCGECNAKYRRPPLAGKCRKCGGKLLLTIHKAGIEKYLGIAKEMAERFDLPEYLKQRLMLIEREIKEVFREKAEKQFSLANFV